MRNNNPRNFKQELAAIEKTFEPQGGLSCASASGDLRRTAAHATPSTTAGARAVCNSNTISHYNVHYTLEKAQRIAKRLHSIPNLYPDDRTLLVQLQFFIKQAKKANNYDPNTKLELFPP